MLIPAGSTNEQPPSRNCKIQSAKHNKCGNNSRASGHDASFTLLSPARRATMQAIVSCANQLKTARDSSSPVAFADNQRCTRPTTTLYIASTATSYISTSGDYERRLLVLSVPAQRAAFAEALRLLHPCACGATCPHSLLSSQSLSKNSLHGGVQQPANGPSNNREGQSQGKEKLGLERYASLRRKSVHRHWLHKRPRVRHFP